MFGGHELNLSGSGRGRMAGSCEHGKEISDSIKGCTLEFN
jgi:hypothetical protein